MDTIGYIILAFIQGVTEFIPVSSSGHLVLFQKLFGFKESMLFFDIIMHLATTFAVIAFLKEELFLISREIVLAINSYSKGESLPKIWQNYAYFREFVFVLAALVPLFFGILLIKPFIDKMFESLLTAGIGFIITGIVLFFTKFFFSERGLFNFSLKDALIIGIGQMVAMVPGISRSGLTISTGIYRGLDKNFAAKFSFLLSIPTILGAVIYKLKDGIILPQISGLDMTICFTTAFFTGYASLIVLSRLIAKAKFQYFSYYCWAMGFLSVILSIIKK